MAATSISCCCRSRSVVKLLWLRRMLKASSKSIRRPLKARSIRNEHRWVIISSMMSSRSALFSQWSISLRNASRITSYSFCVSLFCPFSAVMLGSESWAKTSLPEENLLPAYLSVCHICGSTPHQTLSLGHCGSHQA